MKNLRFNEEKHQYFLENLPIPSVSEIIKPIYQKVYKNIDESTLETAAERGTRIHRAIEFVSKYKLYKLDKDTVGYIQAYENFRVDHLDWELKHSEFRTFHKSLLYGMTIDEVYDTPDGTVILDFKTTKVAHPNAWSVQLSAYKSGYESQHEKVNQIVALQLFSDGGYVVHELKNNLQIFLSCLEIYRFEVDKNG
jgi:ATP-dependent exoDNAse (exonuclease V) beta subunit